MTMLLAEPLTAAAFKPFGEVIALGSVPPLSINEGRCRRYTDLAHLDVAEGRVGLSLFQAEIRGVPLPVGLLERHPLGSQAFLPLGGSECLVVVAPDIGGRPGDPVAFHARADQGVNYARGTWHGVLAPISGSGLFAVVDRIGAGANLEEVRLNPGLRISLPRRETLARP
ncbi:MAG: ureidoglycolate lyase [Pseudomonadota bacterium]